MPAHACRIAGALHAICRSTVSLQFLEAIHNLNWTNTNGGRELTDDIFEIHLCGQPDPAALQHRRHGSQRANNDRAIRRLAACAIGRTLRNPHRRRCQHGRHDRCAEGVQRPPRRARHLAALQHRRRTKHRHCRSGGNPHRSDRRGLPRRCRLAAADRRLLSDRARRRRCSRQFPLRDSIGIRGSSSPCDVPA